MDYSEARLTILQATAGTSIEAQVNHALNVIDLDRDSLLRQIRDRDEEIKRYRRKWLAACEEGGLV